MTPPLTKPFKSILGPLHTYLIMPATPISPSTFKITTVRPFIINKCRNSPNGTPTGLPRNSPTTSPYFSTHPHEHDQYSISFTILPHKTIPGPSLIFGNDFDHPIRDRLPPGFGTALNIVKKWIDPGLDGDAYSDTPHLYGCALSSVNILRVGKKVEKLDDHGGKEGSEEILEEGGDGDGEEWRESRGVPETAAARMKHFLQHGKTEEWEWEEGRVYKGDFFNPYLDFNSETTILTL